MARIQVPITVIDTSGNGVASASVRVQKRSTGADAVLYTTEGGPTTTTNPTTTDAYGRVAAWVDRGAYNATVSGTGITTYVQPFDGAAASDGSIDGAWSGTPTVTSLPGSPVDGQIVNYLADSTNGVVWTLKYRAGSSSSYKWEYVGGAPLSTQSTAATSPTTSTSYGSALTSVTVPRSGEYMVYGAALADIFADTVNSQVLVSLGVAGSPADGNRVSQCSSQAIAQSASAFGSRAMKLTISSSQSVGLHMRVVTAPATATSGFLSLTVVPIRVS